MSADKEINIPSNWAMVKIEDIFDVVGGGTPSTSAEEYWNGDIPWITSADILAPKMIRPRKFITNAGVENSATSLVPSGSIIVVTRVSLGKVGIVDQPLCFSQDSQALIDRLGSINPDYALHYLTLAVNEFKHVGRGTTISGVTKKQLKELEFPLAPIPEQKRIVGKIEELFSQLDAGVAALERAQINLERYKASVLKAACEGRLLPAEAELAHHEGRDYEPASVLLERILAERRKKWEEAEWSKLVEKAKKKAAQARRKSDGRTARISDLEPEEWQELSKEECEKFLPKNEKWKEKYKEPISPYMEGLPELPEGWAWASVDQISLRIQYGSSEKAYKEISGVPILRMGNIIDGELDYSDLKYLPAESMKVDDFILEGGDVLFNRTNSAELVGKTAVYKDYHPMSAFASYLIRVQATRYYLPDLLAFYINSDFGRRFIKSVVSQQVGQANVNGTKLANMPVVVPPFGEQHRIVDYATERLSLIKIVETEISKELRRSIYLRQAILHQAFEGRLIIQDPEDEPAIKLLKRSQG